MLTLTTFVFFTDDNLGQKIIRPLNIISQNPVANDYMTISTIAEV